MGIFDKFKSGFKKSASAFTSGLRDIVIKKEIDDKTLDEIEEYLIQSDVGIVAASEIKVIISSLRPGGIVSASISVTKPCSYSFLTSFSTFLEFVDILFFYFLF